MFNKSNEAAKATWENRAVGSQRANAVIGSSAYFNEIREYRYGYETPFIPRLFRFQEMAGKRVLEIGVGNGIDGVEMARHGAVYHGLDITQNHLDLTRANFANNNLKCRLYEGDLREVVVPAPFDIVYSFGVLHHISHEQDYLEQIRQLLTDDGRLMIGVYSKYSFFNAYLCASYVLKGRRESISLDDWRSHLAELSLLGTPVTIKIRSKREVEGMLVQSGFRVIEYHKRGFVQNYLPVIGKFLKPDGCILNTLGGTLGWYHIFICQKVDHRDPANR